MKKIIVTTDLSVNSKAGIRFAIRLAQQEKLELIFFYVIQLLVPTRWNEVKKKIHMDAEIEVEQEKLFQFVKKICVEDKIRPGKFDCVVRYGAPVSEAVIDYARERKADFICIATRGAGRIKRIIGTHTSALIKHSPIPVFVVPKRYRPARIRQIMYASDLMNLKTELRKIKELGKKWKSEIAVVHYDFLVNMRETRPVFEKKIVPHKSPGVKFHLERFSWERPFGEHVKKTIRKFKPDILALFTRHYTTWYERVLFRSNAADVSFDPHKPLLVFPK